MKCWPIFSSSLLLKISLQNSLFSRLAFAPSQVCWHNLTPNALQIPSQTLQFSTKINSSTVSTSIFIQNIKPSRRNILKHAIEARIASVGNQGFDHPNYPNKGPIGGTLCSYFLHKKTTIPIQNFYFYFYRRLLLYIFTSLYNLFRGLIRMEIILLFVLLNVEPSSLRLHLLISSQPKLWWLVSPPSIVHYKPNKVLITKEDIQQNAFQ